jgi:hypothetical protein
LDSDDVGDEDLSYASGGEEREISESIQEERELKFSGINQVRTKV